MNKGNGTNDWHWSHMLIILTKTTKIFPKIMLTKNTNDLCLSS